MIKRYNLYLHEVANYPYKDEKVTSPASVVRIANDIFHFTKQPEEILGIICLNSKGKPVASFEVSRGTLSSSFFSPREIFKRVITANAQSFLAFHNHPSGDTTPSASDIESTKELLKGAEILGLTFHDHIIIGSTTTDYLSLRESGYVNF